MNTPPRRSGMARVLKGSHSFTCTPRVHPLTEWTIPAFAFPAAEAGTHLPTLAGWKAELALGGRLVTYRDKCLALGTEPRHCRHLSTNWAGRRLTSLIEASTLTLCQTTSLVPCRHITVSWYNSNTCVQTTKTRNYFHTRLEHLSQVSRQSAFGHKLYHRPLAGTKL